MELTRKIKEKIIWDYYLKNPPEEVNMEELKESIETEMSADFEEGFFYIFKEMKLEIKNMNQIFNLNLLN